ncbi:ComE operon protein 3 [Fibrella aestuarina BUZ 2]|uniref:ComE operon protein 3 n=1 Tax=Fibrella aestuarina BUZ 2 TaxID=1166018 RepID=I0K7P0_9BACT|nr:ComEC/Rec2 family competence protein [Fibrella aestuarina]CCH00143.1 ComE operon protein 3 [Fibrella aestuarina BUZ 2]
MRGYPFFRYVAALLIGIVLAEAWPTVSPYWAAGFGLGCLGLYLFRLRRNERKTIKPLDLVQGFALLGLMAALGWGLLYAHTPAHRPDNLLNVPNPPDAYEAVITNLPETRAKTIKVELALRRGRWNDGDSAGYRPLTGRVVAYLDKGDSLAPTATPRYGDVWLVLHPPRLADPPLNPAEFDYRRFLSRRGIYHQQYLRPWQRRVIGYDPPSRLTALAYRVNAWADSLLTQKIGSRAEYGVVNAMFLGTRDDLDPVQYETYAAAGAVHILSVSGMHIGILFIVLSGLLTWLAPGQGNRWWVIGLKLSVLWFYALTTGLSAPVLRSAVMFTYLLLAGGFNRSQSLMNTLGASAFFVLVYDPYAAFSVGFQLSYLSILGIGAWAPQFIKLWRPQTRVANWLWEISMVAVAAQLVALPVSLYYFHAFPVYFLLANPAVALLSTLLVPLAVATVALGWVPVLGDGLGWLLRQVAWLLNAAVDWVGHLPGATFDGFWPSALAVGLMYLLIGLAGMVVLTRHRRYVRLLAGAAVVLALLTVHDVQQQATQRRLVVHYQPRKTTVSLTAGRQTQLLTDADWETNPRLYDFYLKNALDSWGVRQVQTGSLLADTIATLPPYRHTPDVSLLVWEGRSLLLVNRLASYRRWQLPAVVDYVVLRRNALRDWHQLQQRVVARHLIFDGSNAMERVDSLLKTKPPTLASRVHSVRHSGAFVAEW